MQLSFSNKAKRTREQPINALIAAALANPKLINLAAGLVDFETLPVAEVKQAADAILSDPRRGRAALQYETTQGLSELRNLALAHLEELEGKPGASMGLTPEDFVITTGSQQ